MSVVRHTSYNLIGALIPLLVSLLTVPLYLKLIGLERYGVLSLCWVLVGYFGLFEFGLGPATAQRVASMDKQSTELRSENVWGALGLSLLLGIAGCLLLWTIAKPVLGSIKNVGGSLSNEISWSVVWLGLLVPLSTSYAVLCGALQGRQQFLLMNVVTGVGNLLIGVAPLAAVLFLGPQLPHLIGALVASRLCIVAALWIACLKVVPLRWPGRPKAEVIRSLATFGGWVAISAAIVPVLTSAEKVAIGWLIGAAAVSIYMVPMNLVGRLAVFPQSLASALFPRFATVPAEKLHDFEYEALASFSRLVTPIILVAMLGLGPFLHLWVGDKLGSEGAPIGAILLAGAWFNCCSYIPYSRLQGTGQPRVVTKIVLLQLVPYGLLLLLCMRLAGLTGAAIAWSARMAIEMLLLLFATRQMPRLTSAIWLQGGAVIFAAMVAFFAPFPDWWGALILVALLTASLLPAYRSLRSIGLDWRSPRLRSS